MRARRRSVFRAMGSSWRAVASRGAEPKCKAPMAVPASVQKRLYGKNLPSMVTTMRSPLGCSTFFTSSVKSTAS